MIRLPWLLSLFAALTLAPAFADPAPASGAPDRTPAIFRDDARLAAKVTLAWKDRPLGEALAELSRQLRVPLRAGNFTLDDKVTLFVDEKPAAEALGLIERHFDFHWVHAGSNGYELTQTSDSLRREMALRDKAVAARLAAIRARMDAIARLAGTPRDRLQAREREIAARLAAPGLDAGERASLTEERGAIADLQRPGATAALAVYQSLNAAQWRELAASGSLRLATADGTLPPPLAAAIHQAAEEMRKSGRVMRVASATDGAASPDDNLPVSGADALVSLQRLQVMRLGPSPAQVPPPVQPLQLQFVLTSHRGDGMRQMSSPAIWAPTVDTVRETPAAQAADPNDPDLKREIELRFTLAPSQAPGGAAMIRIGGSWPAAPTLGDLAEQMHQAADLEMLTDSFVRDRLNAASFNGRHTVAQLLDEVAKELDYAWEKEGRLIRFRNRTFYDDRPAECPERVLAPWRERVARAGAPNLDDMGDLAAALNDPQCRSMQTYWGWYLKSDHIPAPAGPGGFYGIRQHFRFWAKLAPAQKALLRTGAILPVAQMNGLQRQAFVVALTAPNDAGMIGGPPPLAAAPTAADVAAGGFSLTVREMRQQAFTSAGPNGEQRLAVLIGGGEGEAGSIRAAPPGAPGEELQPAGAPTLLDGATFAYHLAGQETPARTVMIMLPRP
jgi:hypothetical protein